jgi:RimJ/RimL family protein N-acetyltransferase
VSVVELRRIGTERLVLEPVRPEWAAAVVAGQLDALGGLVAGAGWPHADTVDGLRLALDHGGALGWFVTLDGVVVGDCGTHGWIDADGVVEIGYGLAGPFRGRGLATEAVAAMTDFLLGTAGARQVVASTHAAANPASRRVLTKCGFALNSLDGEIAWYSRS